MRQAHPSIARGWVAGVSRRAREGALAIRAGEFSRRYFRAGDSPTRVALRSIGDSFSRTATFWACRLMLCASTAAAASDDEALRELWRMEVGAGIEWAECVSSGGRMLIILCSRDDRIHTLDAATGAASEAPVVVGVGTRFAGARGQEIAEGSPGQTGVAYLFDRYVVYALELGESAGRLRWRSGRWPPDGDAGDDPEFLTPIIAAGACAGGVVAVRSDGRLALLDEQTGAPRWQRQVSPLSRGRLLVGPSAGVILHRAGGRTVGSILRPLANPAAVRTIAPGGGWPIWSEIDDEALVVADLRGVRRMPLDAGEIRTIEAPPGERLLAAAIDGERRASGVVEDVRSDLRDTRDEQAGRLAAVWAGSDSRGLYRFDLERRAVETLLEPQPREAESWTALHVRERAVLVRSDKRLLAIAPDSRRVIARYAVTGEEVIRAAEIVGETLYAVVVSPPAGEQAGDVKLVYFPLLMAGSGEAAADEASRASRAVEATPQRRRLSAGARARQWLWAGPRLVVVEPGALAGYVLPVPATAGD